MSASLKDRTVLVVGQAGGIARAVAVSAREAGARVVAAGGDQAALESAYDGLHISDEHVDVTDDASIDVLGERLGTVDHVVSAASAQARGRLADLDRDAVRLAFDTKVIGPMMLAKHLAPRMPPDGSFVFFSGAAAVKPAIGSPAVAGTDAAVDAVIRSLALELAPVRVNAVSPGTIDTGAWDALGEQAKARFFQFIQDRPAGSPAGRIGSPDDVAEAVLFALASDFLTGQTLHVDGGEPLS
jgi:NAD(P)-dependent dehydrogenase (short-subunit alcohol dehydrogenase family)